MTPAQVAFVVAWAAATGGFVVYLASLDSFKEAYGSVGTGALLLLWMTLFSVLYHWTPNLRPRNVHEAAAPSAGRPQPTATPLGPRVDRVIAPSAALRNTAAQGRMMSVMGPHAIGMSDREVDLMDWGFAFGVAWAVARRQDPEAVEETVSERALHATQAVYQAYRGSPAPVLNGIPATARNETPTADGGNPPTEASAAQPHAYRS
jgi:hypothetical protein